METDDDLPDDYFNKRPGRPRGQKTKPTLDYIATALENERAVVLSRHQARLASRRDSLIQIRSRMFGGGTLKPSKAQTLISQQGPRYFSKNWFDEQGIPVLDHRSSCVDPASGVSPEFATREMVMRFEWNGRTLDVPNASMLMANATFRSRTLKLPVGEMRIAEGSVLDEIRGAAIGLARHYDWSEGHATRFVMTGEPPGIVPVGFRQIGAWRDDHSHFAFLLRIESWVTAKTVNRAIRQLQLDVYGHQVRSIERRALVLFEFVERYREKKFGKSWQELAERNLDFPWTKVAKLWNDKYGVALWPYTPSTMSRDFKRHWITIVHSPLKPLGIRRARKARKKK